MKKVREDKDWESMKDTQSFLRSSVTSNSLFKTPPRLTQRSCFMKWLQPCCCGHSHVAVCDGTLSCRWSSLSRGSSIHRASELLCVCVCSASTVHCFPPSFLCDGILPGRGNSSLLYAPHILCLKEGHALKYWWLIFSLLFHFYMESSITCKAFTAFFLHLKIFFLIWNIESMEEVQLQPEIHTSF